MKQWAKQTGFTVVELLIVIVVIGILATLTIISYSGIQQQANNTAIIDAASKAKRMVEAYVAKTGQFPYTTDASHACITQETTCRRNGGAMTPVAAFDSAMATVGNLPRSAPLVSTVRGGVTYAYIAGRTVDGVAAPASLSFYIFGVNSNCGMPVLSSESGTPTTTSSNSYTVGNVGSSGATQCVVSIDAR